MRLLDDVHLIESEILAPPIVSTSEEGSIFADGQSLQFRGSNFHGCMHSRPLCAVQLSSFHGFNFRHLRKLDPSKISRYTVLLKII